MLMKTVGMHFVWAYTHRIEYDPWQFAQTKCTAHNAYAQIFSFILYGAAKKKSDQNRN